MRYDNNNYTGSTKIYEKRDGFDFDIVNFPFHDGDVPRGFPFGVYVSQLIRFTRASSNVRGFDNCNKFLTANFVNKVYYPIFAKD